MMMVHLLLMFVGGVLYNVAIALVIEHVNVVVFTNVSASESMCLPER